jgi:hypothetical protein
MYKAKQKQILYTRGYNCTWPKRYNCTLIHFQKHAKHNLFMQKYNKLMTKKKLSYSFEFKLLQKETFLLLLYAVCALGANKLLG